MAPKTSTSNNKIRIPSKDTKPKDGKAIDSNIETSTVGIEKSNLIEDGAISSVRVVLLGIMLLTIGAIGFYNLPGMISTDAKGSRLVNAIYCSTITLTTYV
jgi:hypothetical protein